MLNTNVMPCVSECGVIECAYNSNKVCHAIAITIGDGDRPMCDTFMVASKHGGTRETAGVGACKVAVCAHNTDFECCAESVVIGRAANRGKCVTFAAA
jgi:hypothetical protein